VDVDRNLVIKLVQKTNSLQEVTVTSLRASDKSPIAYTNIDKETLSKSNLGQDIPYLLSSTPSLVVSSDGGTGIGYTNFRIRGTDAARINITINGIPYNDPDEQGAYWVDVPDLAASIEILQELILVCKQKTTLRRLRAKFRLRTVHLIRRKQRLRLVPVY
jgi:iron complex outermembrane receptor protein